MAKILLHGVLHVTIYEATRLFGGGGGNFFHKVCTFFNFCLVKFHCDHDSSRPKMTWLEGVIKDKEELCLDEHVSLDRRKWRVDLS